MHSHKKWFKWHFGKNELLVSLQGAHFRLSFDTKLKFIFEMWPFVLKILHPSSSESVIWEMIKKFPLLAIINHF